MIQFDIDIRALKTAAIAVGAEQTRYYLNGVCIQHTAAGPLFVATDGARLIAARHDWADGAPDAFAPVIVPLDLIKRVKIARKAGNVATLTLDYGADAEQRTPRVTIAYDGSSVTANAIDGTFPDWRRVIPRAPASGVTAQYNPDYLAGFSDAIKILEGGKTSNLPVVAHNGDSPALVDLATSGRVQAFGVLMPFRIKRDVLTAAPAWADVTGESVADAA
jgi:DNA polymerase-3 subunit beta